MAAKKATKNELAKKEAAALVTFEGYSDYGQEGFDNTGKEDFSIPFLTVLQQLSPQLSEDDAAYIEGAKQGMILNSVTGDLYSPETGVPFQPVITQHVYVEWVPRNSGGGFVAIHEMDSDVVKAAKAASTQFGKYKVGENDLIETYYMYGNILDENDTVVSQAMVTFTSTKIKVYKAAMTKLRSFQVPVGEGRKASPPLFAHRLRLGAVKQTKNQDKFWNFKIDSLNGSIIDSLIAPGSDLLDMGQAFYKLVKSGEAKVDHAAQNAAGDDKKPKGEVPF